MNDLANQLKISEIGEVGKLVTKIEMDASIGEVGKVVKRIHMNEPKVGKS